MRHFPDLSGLGSSGGAFKVRQRYRWFYFASLMFFLGVAGCSGFDTPTATPTTGRNPTVAEVPSADETVRGEDDPPIVTLELGSALHEHRLTTSEDLPSSIMIPTTNLNAVPVTAALQAVLAGTDVSLSWDTSTFDDHLVTVVNLSGSLPRVVDKICASARVFCSYRHGSIALSDKETFIVTLPPIAKATGAEGSAAAAGNTMADTIGQLAKDKVELDEQGGNIIYTADVDGEERVSQYIEQLRNGRPLVVMQLYIWEVTLNKENSEGVNWTQLSIPKLGGLTDNIALSAPASTLTSVATGGVSLGAITAGKISANVVATFLATQGRVQSISNPQITFVSGSSAHFMAGGNQNYISQVGQLVTASNVSGTSSANSNNGIGTNTVSTATITTGLKVDVSGAYETGVIFANLDLSLTNLTSLQSVDTGAGTSIQLPTTSDRKVSTIIRVRPGDNLVMAGMVTSNDNTTSNGVPLPADAKVPLYGDETLANNELVIMVKPSVVLFSDKAANEEAKKAEESKPLPDAVVIDKDGAKALAIPQGPATPQPVSLLSEPAAVKPELMVSAPDAVSLLSTPIAPSEDGAPVDRRLMQRGFSHAYDDLLQPASSDPGAAPSGESKP